MEAHAKITFNRNIRNIISKLCDVKEGDMYEWEMELCFYFYNSVSNTLYLRCGDINPKRHYSANKMKRNLVVDELKDTFGHNSMIEIEYGFFYDFD